MALPSPEVFMPQIHSTPTSSPTPETNDDARTEFAGVSNYGPPGAYDFASTSTSLPNSKSPPPSYVSSSTAENRGDHDPTSSSLCNSQSATGSHNMQMLPISYPYPYAQPNIVSQSFPNSVSSQQQSMAYFQSQQPQNLVLQSQQYPVEPAVPSGPTDWLPYPVHQQPQATSQGITGAAGIPNPYARVRPSLDVYHRALFQNLYQRSLHHQQQQQYQRMQAQQQDHQQGPGIASSISPVQPNVCLHPQQPHEQYFTSENGSNNIGRHIEQLNPAQASSDATTPAASSTAKRYSHAQVEAMHASLNSNPYPNKDAKERLSAQIGLSTDQISRWMCRERKKRSVAAVSGIEERAGSGVTMADPHNRRGRKRTLPMGTCGAPSSTSQPLSLLPMQTSQQPEIIGHITSANSRTGDSDGISGGNNASSSYAGPVNLGFFSIPNRFDNRSGQNPAILSDGSPNIGSLTNAADTRLTDVRMCGGNYVVHDQQRLQALPSRSSVTSCFSSSNDSVDHFGADDASSSAGCVEPPCCNSPNLSEQFPQVEEKEIQPLQQQTNNVGSVNMELQPNGGNYGHWSDRSQLLKTALLKGAHSSCPSTSPEFVGNALPQAGQTHQQHSFGQSGQISPAMSVAFSSEHTTSYHGPVSQHHASAAAVQHGTQHHTQTIPVQYLQQQFSNLPISTANGLVQTASYCYQNGVSAGPIFSPASNMISDLKTNPVNDIVSTAAGTAMKPLPVDQPASDSRSMASSSSPNPISIAISSSVSTSNGVEQQQERKELHHQTQFQQHPLSIYQPPQSYCVASSSFANTGQVSDSANRGSSQSHVPTMPNGQKVHTENYAGTNQASDNPPTVGLAPPLTTGSTMQMPSSQQHSIAGQMFSALEGPPANGSSATTSVSSIEPQCVGNAVTKQQGAVPMGVVTGNVGVGALPSATGLIHRSHTQSGFGNQGGEISSAHVAVNVGPPAQFTGGHSSGRRSDREGTFQLDSLCTDSSSSTAMATAPYTQTLDVTTRLAAPLDLSSVCAPDSSLDGIAPTTTTSATSESTMPADTLELKKKYELASKVDAAVRAFGDSYLQGSAAVKDVSSSVSSVCAGDNSVPFAGTTYPDYDF